MAPPITYSKITLKYPLYCADFLKPPSSASSSQSGSRALLVVAGGGGEGRSGVGNKISLVDVTTDLHWPGGSEEEPQPKLLGEKELSKNEDAVMSLSASQEVLLCGINSAEMSCAKGVNEHLRVFEVADTPEREEDGELIQEVGKVQVFSKEVIGVKDTYQRLARTTMAHGGKPIAAIASGGGGGMSGAGAVNEIVVVDVKRGAVNSGLRVHIIERIQTKENREAADLDIWSKARNDDRDGWILAYCNSTELYVYDKGGKGKQQKLVNKIMKGKGTFRSTRFLSNRYLLAVINLPMRTGAELVIIDLDKKEEDRIVARKSLHRGVKAATSLDVSNLPSGGLDIQQSVIAIAGADQSVEILIANIAAPVSASVVVLERDSSEKLVGDEQAPIALLLPSPQRSPPPKLKAVKLYNNVHPFQVTKIAFSPPIAPRSNLTSAPPKVADQYTLKLSTVSMGQTIVTYTIPLQKVAHTAAKQGEGDNKIIALYLLPPPSGPSVKSTIISVIFSLLFIVMLAVALQLFFEYRIVSPLRREWKGVAAETGGQQKPGVTMSAMEQCGEEKFCSDIKAGKESVAEVVEQETFVQMVSQAGESNWAQKEEKQETEQREGDGVVKSEL